MLSVGVLHGQTSLPHTHRPDTTQLLRTESQHATTNLPAPSQTENHRSALLPACSHIQHCHGALPARVKPSRARPRVPERGLAAQKAGPAKQLLENASGAASPQKGSPASRSAPAPPADEVLL